MEELNPTTENVAYARELRALYRAAEQRAVRFRLLVETGRDLVTMRDTDDLLRLALARVTTFSGYDTGAVLLADVERSLVVRAALAIRSPLSVDHALAPHVFEQAARAMAQGSVLQSSLNDPLATRSQNQWSAEIYLPLLPINGQSLGVLWLAGDASPIEPEADDLDALELLATQLAAAVQSAQLHEDKDLLVQRLLEREHQLAELVNRLMSVQEEERRRVAYELHDGLAQMALGVLQQLNFLAGRYRPRAVPARKALQRALDMAQATVNEARQLIAGLRPTVLDAFGLVKALRTEIKALQDDGWEVTLEESLGGARLAPAIETALFRITQEALNNIRKHAGVTKVCITLHAADEVLELVIQDYGRGFNPQERLTDTTGTHVGLSSIQERIRLLDGSWRLESQRGLGTRLEARLPITPGLQGA